MAITPGSSLNSVPSAQRQVLNTNYLDLSTSAGWGQQYVPDLMEKEADVFGSRTISGFLAQVGAEEAMTADQVIWSEQSRLHLSYKGTVDVDGDISGGDNKGLFTVVSDIDGNTNGVNGFAVADHGVRINDVVLLAYNNTICRAIVSEVAAGTNGKVELRAFGTDTLPGSDASGTAATLLVIGSEFAKGVDYGNIGSLSSSRTSNEPTFKTFSNKPIIIKDYYSISGSDASRIGWVEVSTEGGQGGFLWYLKAESETRLRFADYLEMMMLESIDGVPGTDNVDNLLGVPGSNTGATGTQGLFDAIEKRGNISSGVTGTNAATDLAEFDAILAEFDNQGAIEENMFFVNRATSLAIDDMLASMNSYGAGGTSYGVFDNSEDMALNLGFSGFRRGSYDFYKSDFRYLNDKATRGGINTAAGTEAIRGVVIPAGTSSVYDGNVGTTMRRPFLHVRFRSSATDDRRMKTWVTGSVGAATSALDVMELHMLSERCLITQGANNFMLLK